MINNIVIVGRLTKDPQIYEKEGKKLATFCVAVNRSYKDKDQNTICDYLYCKAFGKLAHNIEHYINQGSLVGVTGKLQSSKYEKEGQTHFVSEIFVESIKFMSKRATKESTSLYETIPLDAQQQLTEQSEIANNKLFEIV